MIKKLPNGNWQVTDLWLKENYEDLRYWKEKSLGKAPMGASEVTYYKQEMILAGTSSAVAVFPPVIKYIFISCGSGKGNIKIFFNGKIELENTDLDEAAKDFWNRIAASFPVFKQTILDEYVKSLTVKKEY